MRISLITILLCVAISGCARKEVSSAMAPLALEANKKAESPARFIAYEHSIALDVEDNRVVTVYKSVETACQQAIAEQCVILESNLNTGRYVSALVKIRAKPEGIRKIIASISTQGDVVRQSVSAEDLAAPIEDSEKKLAMLNDYRTKLESLRGKASSDIDALIKVNKELAQVQSDIEGLTGEKAHLMQRVETEMLSVSISSIEGRAFWRPIGNSLSDFGRNLSDGISTAITALAYILPWVIMLMMFWLGGRKLWYRRKKLAGKA